ncbi:hypothetical protein B484DRAFT_409049, partial [Ochromonadaceae sp. CCMP2298]
MNLGTQLMRRAVLKPCGTALRTELTAITGRLKDQTLAKILVYIDERFGTLLTRMEFRRLKALAADAVFTGPDNFPVEAAELALVFAKLAKRSGSLSSDRPSNLLCYSPKEKAETHTISDAGGFAAGYFHCLTLKVHSSLESVGLTATNSKLFAEAGIPAKIDAGFYHNHVFVPSCKSSHALAILNDCSSAAVVSSPLVLESSGVPSNAPSLAMVKEGKGKKRTSEAQLVSVAEAETELT